MYYIIPKSFDIVHAFVSHFLHVSLSKWWLDWTMLIYFTIIYMTYFDFYTKARATACKVGNQCFMDISGRSARIVSPYAKVIHLHRNEVPKPSGVISQKRIAVQKGYPSSWNEHRCDGVKGHQLLLNYGSGTRYRSELSLCRWNDVPHCGKLVCLLLH